MSAAPGHDHAELGIAAGYLGLIVDTNDAALRLRASVAPEQTTSALYQVLAEKQCRSRCARHIQPPPLGTDRLGRSTKVQFTASTEWAKLFTLGTGS